MEEEILKSIDKKLDTMIILLARTFVQGKNKAEDIRVLGSFGLEINTIAAIVDTTPATVSTRLWEQRKKSATKEKTKTTKKTESTK